MSDYYDREGNPISSDEWAARFEEDRVVARTKVVDKVVSTVYLGLDHSFGGTVPQIFETMIFPSEDDFTEEFCQRYATENDAIRGHHLAVTMLLAELPSDEEVERARADVERILQELESKSH